jgi:hypothetical protein
LITTETLSFNQNFNEQAFNAAFMDLCEGQRYCSGQEKTIAPEVFLNEQGLEGFASNDF